MVLGLGSARCLGAELHHNEWDAAQCRATPESARQLPEPQQPANFKARILGRCNACPPSANTRKSSNIFRP